MSCIYIIRNLINGKAYIGQTKNFAQRKAAHKYEARRGDKRHLYVSMRKYGIENFEFSILEECSLDILSEREQYWVDVYDTFNPEKGYNLTKGGGWHPRTDETRKKISDSHLGKKLTEEHRQHISESQMGRTSGMLNKTHSLETKMKMSKSAIGKKKPPRTKEHRENMRQAKLGSIPWNTGKSGYTVTPRTDESKLRSKTALLNSESRLEYNERQRQAIDIQHTPIIDLAKDGLTFAQIMQKLNMTRKKLRRILKRAIERQLLNDEYQL